MSNLPGVAEPINAYRGDRLEIFLLVQNEEFDEDIQDWVSQGGVNLTGYTLKGQIKKAAEDNTAVAEFGLTLGNQATTPGSIFGVLLPAQSAAIPPGTYVFDIQGTLDVDHVETFVVGTFIQTADVTR